ncbi:PAS domain S-box protein [Candidatus Daviesbacteria bacterium]|nr:PAS domain S-box protein [Candidatus Daviesbacteria bacterium]
MFNLLFTFLKGRLRFKFILLIIGFALVPLITVMVVTIFRLQTVEKENAYKQSRQIAQSAAKEIDSFIQSQFSILDNISNIYPQLKQDQEKQTFLERMLFKNSNFNELIIIDPAGIEIAKIHTQRVITKSDLTNRSSSPEYIALSSTGLFMGSSELVEGRPQFLIGRWIKDEEGKFLGGILAYVDARIMQEVVLNITSLENRGRAYIVDEKGVVVAHPDLSQILGQRKLTIPKVNNSQVYKNELKQEVLGVSFPIILSFPGSLKDKLDTHWFVVAEQYADIALAPVKQLTQFTVITLVIVLIISLLGTALFVNRIIRPIEQLHSASKKIGQGNFAYKVQIKTGDEIEDLGSEFNKMGDNLQTIINILRRNKELISAERDKLEVMLSGITDAVIALDLERRIVSFNAAAQRLTGYKKDEVLGKKIGELLSFYDENGKLAEAIYSPIRVTGFEGTVYERQNLMMETNEGRKASVNLITGQISEGLQANIGCILTLHDVTEEGRLEEMKLDFVSMAAHELRTPLTTINGYLSILQSEFKSLFSGDALLYLQRAMIASSQLRGLIENLLNVAGIERGMLTMKPKAVNWVELVGNAVEEMQSRASDKQVSLSFYPPIEALPLVKADPLRIGEVIYNILTNSINFTPSGGKITVSLERQGNYAITHISDNGVGIAKEDMLHLFTKFFRIVGRLQMGSKGTGLGLYISKSIVEMHQGKIWAESQIGKGTTVSFSLPFFES